jgi:hypothetical protein
MVLSVGFTECLVAKTTHSQHRGHVQQHNSSALPAEAPYWYGDLDPVVFAASVSPRCESVVRKSTLYVPECFQQRPRVLRQLLVTGAGGSGTHYAVELFGIGGVELEHEKIGRDGASAWTYAINDELATGWERAEIIAESNVPFPPHGGGYCWGRLSDQHGLPPRDSDAAVTVEPRFEQVNWFRTHQLESEACAVANRKAGAWRGGGSRAATLCVATTRKAMTMVTTMTTMFTTMTISRRDKRTCVAWVLARA